MSTQRRVDLLASGLKRYARRVGWEDAPPRGSGAQSAERTPGSPAVEWKREQWPAGAAPARTPPRQLIVCLLHLCLLARRARRPSVALRLTLALHAFVGAVNCHTRWFVEHSQRKAHFVFYVYMLICRSFFCFCYPMSRPMKVPPCLRGKRALAWPNFVPTGVRKVCPKACCVGFVSFSSVCYIMCQF